VAAIKGGQNHQAPWVDSARQGELEFDEELALLREGQHGEARFGLDAFDGGGALRRRLGAQHEPHVQRMVAPVVVRDLGVGVDLGRHCLVALLGHGHGSQHEQAARALDLEQRAEAREHAALQQGRQPTDDIFLGPAELGGHIGEGAFGQRQVAVQALQQAGIIRRQHRAPPVWRRRPGPWRWAGRGSATGQSA
jgi:hypothetical protein